MYNLSQRLYSRTSTARTPLEPWKYVRDRVVRAHRGDSNEYTQFTIFNIKRKIDLKYLRSAATGFFRSTSSEQPWLTSHQCSSHWSSIVLVQFWHQCQEDASWARSRYQHKRQCHKDHSKIWWPVLWILQGESRTWPVVLSFVDRIWNWIAIENVSRTRSRFPSQKSMCSSLTDGVNVRFVVLFPPPKYPDLHKIW